jgi:hypothetical protein
MNKKLPKNILGKTYILIYINIWEFNIWKN